MKRPESGLRRLILAVLLTLVAMPGWAEALRVLVIAPEAEHLAWASARILRDHGERAGLDIRPLSPAAATTDADPDLIIMPVRSLASRLEALQILELPFVFQDINAVHTALDGQLGSALRDRARQAGWKILAFWDEGLHVMSGLRRYDRVANLNGMEFLLTRPDPVAERQFHAWRATPRTIEATNGEAVLRECLIASRAATLQEIKREGLERVHMTLALTRHRYEGWLLLAPAKQWQQLSKDKRATLEKILPQVTEEQRIEAARREAIALAALNEAGLIVHRLDDRARNAFMQRLPPRDQLLSEQLDPQTREDLLSLVPPSANSSRSTAQRAPATRR